MEAKLGIGPISEQAVEATYQYSHENNEPLMLIPSKNQVDYDGGYVNNWATRDFIYFCDDMASIYNYADISICRDHCGPGFKDGVAIDNLDDIRHTIGEDINCGFHLIHIDYSRWLNHDANQLALGTIKYIIGLDKTVELEIGNEDNNGEINHNFAAAKRLIEEVCSIKRPEFYVFQTGSLVKECQVGVFNIARTKEAVDFLYKYNIKLKEHNADGLQKVDFPQRLGVVDAMNIAPQLGWVQTGTVLLQASLYDISTEKFKKVIENGNKWRKWVRNNDLMFNWHVAGHYHYTHEEYRKLIDELDKYCEIEYIIINRLKEVINHYVNNFR